MGEKVAGASEEHMRANLQTTNGSPAEILGCSKCRERGRQIAGQPPANRIHRNCEFQDGSWQISNLTHPHYCVHGGWRQDISQFRCASFSYSGSSRSVPAAQGGRRSIKKG